MNDSRTNRRAREAIADDPSFRPLLVRVLRNAGFGAICKGEPRSYNDLGTVSSYALMSGFLLGVVGVLSDWLNVGSWGWFGLLVGVTFLLALSGAIGAVQPAALVLVLVWCGFAVVQFAKADSDVAETLVLPFVVTAVLVWVGRQGRLSMIARVSPLLLPVTLTVLLIPLFTDDLWKAASELEVRHFGLLAVLLLLPLGAQLTRQMRAEMDVVILSAGRDVLAHREDTAEELVQRLVKLVDKDGRETLSAELAPEATKHVEAVDGSHLQAVRDVLLPSLRRRAVGRVAWTALGLTASVSVYLYVLAWTLVPVSVSGDWLSTPVETTSVDLLLIDFSAPLGPYVAVAVLMGIVAAAVLIGFVITEERYAGDVSAAVLYAPVRDGLVAALPYAVMTEEEPPLDGVGRGSTSPGETERSD